MNQEQKWYSLYDKVYSMANLQKAWQQVKAGKGAGGIDRVSIQQYETNLAQNLNVLEHLLRTKQYTPRTQSISMQTIQIL